MDVGPLGSVQVAICGTADRSDSYQRVRDSLSAAGFALQFWQRPDDAAGRPADGRPDLLILLCGPSGNAGDTNDGPHAASLVRRVRAGGFAAPIMVIGGIATAEHAAAVLNHGADDCIRSSCDTVEVVARVRALLRRSCEILQLGSANETLAFDRCRHVLTDGSIEVALTSREAALLECLARRAGEPVTREELTAHVWGAEDRGGSPTNIVDVYVAHLRRKLKQLGHASLIRSARGIGYELAVSRDARIDIDG